MFTSWATSTHVWQWRKALFISNKAFVSAFWSTDKDIAGYATMISRMTKRRNTTFWHREYDIQEFYLFFQSRGIRKIESRVTSDYLMHDMHWCTTKNCKRFLYNKAFVSYMWKTDKVLPWYTTMFLLITKRIIKTFLT
jgi:hypothetical protein